MSLKDEIYANYLDSYMLVGPRQVSLGTIRACDNGTLFRSEYDILLQMLGQSSDMDKSSWEAVIRSCMAVPGLTARAPKDTATDAPDNLYGIIAASKVLNKPSIAEDILNYGIRNFGFYNPSNPHSIKTVEGNIDWSSFQWRQLQMVFAMLCASNRYRWYSLWLHPLALFTALVIATSCLYVDPSDTDARILTWLLIQATTKDSIICKLASKIWFSRLSNDYGTDGMHAVFYVYFEKVPIHPITKYFPTT